MNRIFKEIILSARSVSKDILGGDFYTDIPDGTMIPIDPSTHTTPDGQSGWMFEATGGSYSYFKYTGYGSAVSAYDRCPTVNAIVNRKAQAFNNGKVWVLNSTGKEATSPVATRIRNLIRRPNPLQSWKQFEAQAYIYQQLFGFAIMLPIKPAGFTDNTYTTSLWNIPASWIDIKATEENFTRLGGVALTELVVNFQNSKVVFQLKDLIIIRDNIPSFTTLTFPGSKIVSLELPINNIIGSFESRNVLINYRGALGILSSDPGTGQFAAIPMDDKQKLALQQDFRRYGLRNRQMQVIMTTAQLKWQQMGYATKDLMLHEEVVESSKSICDVLHFPPHLLGLIDPTFNNQNTAEKGLYNNCIIPDAESFYEQLTNWFGLVELNLKIDKDFSHLPILQENAGEKATARKTLDEALKMEFEMGLITINDWLIELGKDPLPAEIGNVRATDPKSVPLATVIGVGGVQGLIAVTTSSMSPEAKQATLEIVFGLTPADAARMAAGSTQTEDNEQGQQTSTTTTESTEEEEGE